jgi:arylsulfatase A-like enzyme
LIGDGGRDNEHGGRPNILVIWGDDIGISNLSYYSDGVKAARFTVDQVMDRRLAGIASR